jgi:hypothetical protein
MPEGYRGRKCGKQRTWGRGFLEVWQRKDLAGNFVDLWQIKHLVKARERGELRPGKQKGRVGGP